MKRAAPEPEGGHLQNGVKAQAVEHGYPSETGNSEEVSLSILMCGNLLTHMVARCEGLSNNVRVPKICP